MQAGANDIAQILDFYEAAAYWSLRSAESAKARQRFALTVNFATDIRRKAEGVGVGFAQLDGAEDAARACIRRGDKPWLAGESFEVFYHHAARPDVLSGAT